MTAWRMLSRRRHRSTDADAAAAAAAVLRSVTHIEAVQC
jgi:hypothetical protein